MTWGWELTVGAGLVFLSRVFYRRAVRGNERFGEISKAMFDTYSDKVPTRPALDVISEKTAIDFDLAKTTWSEKNMAAWRFLRWHTYKDPVSEKITDIETGKEIK